MEKSIHHITEFRQNQDIDYTGITSFKVQNNGESVVDINTIPVYPGTTLKLVEEDGTFCNLNFKAIFTEEGKLPKCKAIYKQLESEANNTDNAPVLDYKVTLYGYGQGDIVDFSQNISGHTFLTRSFDGGVTFLPENDIDLGFVEANTVVFYDRGGSLDTNAIQLRNNDLEVNSEIFVVGKVTPFIAFVTYNNMGEGPITFHFNKDVSNLSIEAKMENGDWHLIDSIQNVIKDEEKNSPLIYPSWGVGNSKLRFIDVENGSISEVFDINFMIL